MLTIMAASLILGAWAPPSPVERAQVEALSKTYLEARTAERWDEAERAMRQALAIEERTYGPGDPLVALSLSLIADVAEEAGRYEEAEPLLRRALGIFLGFAHRNDHEHPQRQRIESNYRKLLSETGLDAVQIDQRIAEMVAEARHRP